MSKCAPPPVNHQPPAIQTYASKFPGSPEDQAYLRGQHNAKQQTALNAKHAGGRRRRRRRRSRRRHYAMRGGAASPSPAPSPDSLGWVDPDNPTWVSPDDPHPSWVRIPQSHTGVHEAGPQTANRASILGNKALMNGNTAARYDSCVQFTPTMGQSQSGGRRRRKRRSRRRRGGYLPTIDRLDENILSALTDKQKAQAIPFFSKINEIIMTEGAWIDAQKAPGGGRRRRKTRRRRRRRKTRRTKRKKKHRRRRRTKRGGCSTCLLG